VIGRVERTLRAFRRYLSRSEWMARLLRLPVSRGTRDSPGLVMVQIDGLSRPELERALGAGEMPFLRHLVDGHHYHAHLMYAGVPSSTAAVQAELFYGARSAVAGFNFFDRETGTLVRMFEPETAARIEARIAATGGEPLLAGGSCYADNFTGGAAEPHYCPASSWSRLREAHLLVRIIFAILNLFSFVRIAALMALELVLAVVDCVRGLIAGQDLWREIRFIPMRVGVVVLLRELSTIGAKMDVARGLPIVHVNFLGYDEQAHRRGPGSRFAHWTLKGIDDAIARIWRAAERSGRRHYEVWIYSDHGQERTRSFESVHGREFEQSVVESFATELGRDIACRISAPIGMRRRYARGPRGPDAGKAGAVEDVALLIAPLGPVAMIYYRDTLGSDEMDRIARRLAGPGGVPLLLARAGRDQALAWTAEGQFQLPKDAGKLLGEDHPFLHDVARDLVALCHHADAGTLIACGWRAGIEPLSFAIENGAHGGVAPRETSAFALLPDDAPLQPESGTCLRPLDLRCAALRRLGREAAVYRFPRERARSPLPDRIRVMTYNVHSCIGMDGRLSPERIARTIARFNPDIVALQELDVRRSRTGGVDQAELIAGLLHMDYRFHPAIHLEDERYGDAILSRFPMRLVRAAVLPGIPGTEPRGALWVAIDPGGDVEVNVINTHLGLTALERRMQVQALLGPEWIDHPDCSDPVILCGDFNAIPSSLVCRMLRTRLRDVQLEHETHRPRATFFTRFPMARIDYVFVSPGVGIRDIDVPSGARVRVASDHLPLIVDLVIGQTSIERRHEALGGGAQR
jgi:endonuclease/exonuclease/phosphatase family metal-dependent hydrolase